MMETKIYFSSYIMKAVTFSLFSLTSSKRNLWTDHNQPDLLISAELGKCGMIADWNSCQRYKRAVRLHSLLLLNTYLSHSAEGAFSSLTFLSGRWPWIWKSEADTDRKTYMRGLGQNTPPNAQAKAAVRHALQTDLACEGEEKNSGSPTLSYSKWFSSLGTSSFASTRSIAKDPSEK